MDKLNAKYLIMLGVPRSTAYRWVKNGIPKKTKRNKKRIERVNRSIGQKKRRERKRRKETSLDKLKIKFIKILRDLGEIEEFEGADFRKRKIRESAIKEYNLLKQQGSIVVFAYFFLVEDGEIFAEFNGRFVDPEVVENIVSIHGVSEGIKLFLDSEVIEHFFSTKRKNETDIKEENIIPEFRAQLI